MIKEEEKILKDLETTNVFNMRPVIKNYIQCQVQVYRKGSKYKISQLNEKIDKKSMKMQGMINEQIF